MNGHRLSERKLGCRPFRAAAKILSGFRCIDSIQADAHLRLVCGQNRDGVAVGDADNTRLVVAQQQKLK